MPEKKDLDKVRELFQRVQDSITTAKAQEEGVEVSSKVLFVVDKRFWYFDRDKDVWLMDQPYSPEKAKSMAFDCAVYTDAQTMIALSMDRLKPMSAFLSGKLKMEGDRKSFLAIAPYLKQSMRTESTATAPIEVQIIGTVVESSTGETYLSRHSIGGDEDDEDDEDRPVGGTRKSVTKYILRVNDSICQEQWELLHRFSDFIRLKKDLEKEGYKAIPKVKGKSSIFKSQDVLVKERIAHLNLFLHQLVSLIGTDSTVLNNFLGNSARGLLKSTAQKSSDLHSELTRKETMTSIRNHANRPISWNKKSVLRDTNLVNEIATAKKKVDDLQRVVEGSDKADGGILLYVSAVIRQFVLFVLVFSTCFRLLMESDVHPVGDALLTFQVCCILIALIMKEARYYTFLYIFISVLSLGNEKSYSFFKWLAVFLKHALALFSSRIAGGISVNQFDVFRLSSVGWQGFLSFVSSILFILQNECYSTTLKVGCMFYYCITSFWGGSAVAVVMYIYILLQKHYARIQIILLGDVTSKKKLLSEAESGLVERANDSVDDPAVSNFMREISLLRYRIQGLRLRRTSSILSYLYPFSSYTVAFIVVRLAHNPSNTWLSIQLGLLFSTLLICFLRKETKISLILSYFLSVVLITCSSDLESLFHTFISDINKSTDTAISEISAKVSSYQLNTTTIVEMLSDTYLNLGVVANKVAFLLLEDFKGSRNLLIYLAALGFLLMLSNSYYRRMIRIYIMGTWLVAFYATLAIVMSILRLSDAKKTVVYDLIDPVVAPFVSYNISQFRSIFLKFAQYLGGRVDVMSEHWTHAFSKLHDSCPPSSRSYVKKLIEGELGVGVEDIFESFDWNPMASASIGQAHCATIRSSTITELFSNRKDLLVDSRGKCQNFDLQEYLNYTMAEFGIRRDDPFFQVKKKVEVDSNDNKIISVVVKVQHENIANIMNSDMRIVIFFVQIAASLDSRWKVKSTILFHSFFLTNACIADSTRFTLHLAVDHGRRAGFQCRKLEPNICSKYHAGRTV